MLTSDVVMKNDKRKILQDDQLIRQGTKGSNQRETRGEIVKKCNPQDQGAVIVAHLMLPSYIPVYEWKFNVKLYLLGVLKADNIFMHSRLSDMQTFTVPKEPGIWTRIYQLQLV